jgi:Transposase, Mutator family
VEGAMGVEMTHHLGYEKHGTAAEEGAGNARNGTSPKTLKGDFGQVQIEVRGIAPAASSRRSSLSINVDSQASMTRSCRCMRVE